MPAQRKPTKAPVKARQPRKPRGAPPEPEPVIAEDEFSNALPIEEPPPVPEDSQPLRVHDGLEHYLVYPGDNAYRAVQAIAPDDKGVRHVSVELLEGIQTWWWRNAVTKAEELVAGLELPWGDLVMTDDDVAQGDLLALSSKLARISFYIFQCNNRLTMLMANRAAAKETLEHAVNRNLARPYEGDGVKPALDVRRAVMISSDKRMRNMKIEIIEAGTAITMLEMTKESLDVLWRTVSRVMSARLGQPID